MGTVCSQSWKVEALRDGRLAGTDADAFARHAGDCRACAAVTHQLDEIAAMLAAVPVTVPDPLAVRRGRQRLLAEADAVATGRTRGTSRGRVAAALTLAAVSAAAAVTFSIRHRPPMLAPTEMALSRTAPAAGTEGTTPDEVAPAAPAPTPPPPDVAPFGTVVTAEPGASWSRIEGRQRVRIRLDHGTLHIKVTHGPSEKRLVFLVPDGTIQDLGTTFSVTVAKGRTRAVSVSEGRVALRLRGRAAIQIAAGGSWEATPDLSSDEHRAAAGSTSARAEAPTGGCSDEATWNDAMSSFHAERYAGAAAAFETFSATCRDDRRSEDAAYLTMVALARAGRHEEARAAARRYLVMYPHGFRRHESERFLDGAETPKGPSR